MQKSISLQYEPASDLLHISAKWLFPIQLSSQNTTPKIEKNMHRGKNLHSAKRDPIVFFAARTATASAITLTNCRTARTLTWLLFHWSHWFGSGSSGSSEEDESSRDFGFRVWGVGSTVYSGSSRGSSAEEKKMCAHESSLAVCPLEPLLCSSGL